MILACEHFRSVVAGAEVIIHTDHLNNTDMNLALKQPDKILRMLLKVEALIVPRWMYAPGRGQIGDGLSRNPEDRDRVRQESEDRSHLPKTLAEAFELVSKCRLDGGLVDDCEAVTRTLTQHTPTADSASSSGVGLSPNPDASKQKRLNPIDDRQFRRQKRSQDAAAVASDPPRNGQPLDACCCHEQRNVEVNRREMTKLRCRPFPTTWEQCRQLPGCPVCAERRKRVNPSRNIDSVSCPNNYFINGAQTPHHNFE
mgnify:CR=1 FL=1